MVVRDGMNRTVVTVGPGHTLREAARRMTRADVATDSERWRQAGRHERRDERIPVDAVG